MLELGDRVRGHNNAKQRPGTGREDEYLIRLQLQRKSHAGCLEGAQEPHANTPAHHHSPRLGVLATRHRGRIGHLEAAVLGASTSASRHS